MKKEHMKVSCQKGVRIYELLSTFWLAQIHCGIFCWDDQVAGTDPGF